MRHAATLAALLTLTACSGGGGTSSISDAGPPPPRCEPQECTPDNLSPSPVCIASDQASRGRCGDHRVYTSVSGGHWKGPCECMPSDTGISAYWSCDGEPGGRGFCATPEYAEPRL